MAIHKWKDFEPNLAEGVYISESAQVIGRTKLGTDSSVFFNAVIRGDINAIEVGARSNIQDNCTLHVSDDYACIVGADVTVGHNAILHACTIGDNVLIGMGSIVMDGAVIGDNCIVGAGSVVPPGKKFEAGSLILGSPAKVIRQVKPEETDQKKFMVKKYLRVKNEFLNSEN